MAVREDEGQGGWGPSYLLEKKNSYLDGSGRQACSEGTRKETRGGENGRNLGLCESVSHSRASAIQGPSRWEHRVREAG